MTKLAFVKNFLGYRAGDWVEVKSADEILATLDDKSSLEHLPFMPEMLQYCGKRFRIFKSAHKACDTIQTHKSRWMSNAVHLEGLRCDGRSHDGCQAGCLLYWKDVWVKRVSGPNSTNTFSGGTLEITDKVASQRVGCDYDALTRATRVPASDLNSEAQHYRCQATELFRATTALEWWRPLHYLKDLISKNVSLVNFIYYVAIAAFNVVMRLHWRLRPYPYVSGVAGQRTPMAVDNLQPGEFVRVRSREEIMQTLLSGGNRNRGLSFDVEMIPYCGKTFRVLRRVEKIINDKTGRMIRFPNTCLILDGVTCGGFLSKDRLFCPRSIYPYWHEVWLQRTDPRRQSTPSNK